MTASVKDKQLSFLLTELGRKWQFSDIIRGADVSGVFQSSRRIQTEAQRSGLEAQSFHMHHLADRKPSRPNSLTIDKLLNFKLPRCRTMKDEVGEGRREKEGKHHLSQLNRNWLSPSGERCEGWDWIMGLLPRGGVCTVCVLNSPTRWTRNTAEQEMW